MLATQLVTHSQGQMQILDLLKPHLLKTYFFPNVAEVDLLTFIS